MKLPACVPKGCPAATEGSRNRPCFFLFARCRGDGPPEEVEMRRKLDALPFLSNKFSILARATDVGYCRILYEGDEIIGDGSLTEFGGFWRIEGVETSEVERCAQTRWHSK